MGVVEGLAYGCEVYCVSHPVPTCPHNKAGVVLLVFSVNKDTPRKGATGKSWDLFKGLLVRIPSGKTP